MKMTEKQSETVSLDWGEEYYTTCPLVSASNVDQELGWTREEFKKIGLVVRTTTGRADLAELLDEDHLFELRQSTSTELDRPRRCQVAVFGEHGPPHVVRETVGAERSDPLPAGRKVRVEEVPDRLPERHGVGVVARSRDASFRDSSPQPSVSPVALHHSHVAVLVPATHDVIDPRRRFGGPLVKRT